MTPFVAEVLSNEAAGSAFRKLVVSAPQAFEAGVCPGQFAHIKVPNADELLLRRPISIMDADSAAGTLTFCVLPKGKGTEIISSLTPGSKVEMVAPLGHGFDDKGAKNIWLIGGGVGVAPMVYTAKSFSKSAEVTAVMGFRNAETIFAKDEFESCCKSLVICTDDGSCGIHGTVVDGAKSAVSKPDLICACGPTPMLRAVQAFALENDIPCQLSLEQRMGCGYGACLTCSCKTKGEDGHIDHSRVCADGPVFDAREVLL